ncbi:DNA translocase FtsK [Bacillus sp. B1-b2]|nr:DNA translocase FtsK [Bacillus sp. B1-b2]
MNQTEHLGQESDFIQESDPHKEWRKEVESKVIYQYPKGKFRFPLIPDEYDKKETPIENQNNGQGSQAREGRTRKKNRNTNIPPQPSVENQTKPTKIDPPDHTYKSKRPFKPSETISPIYGYNRPKLANESKELDPKELQEESSYEMKDPTVTSTIIPKPEKRDLLIPEVSEEFVVHESLQKSMHSIELEKGMEEPTEISDFIKNEETSSLEEEMVAFHSESLLIEAIIQPFNNTDEDVQEASVKIYPTETIAETEEIDIETMEETEQETEEEIPLFGDSNKEADNQASRKRGPLPFNVLMLHKDRQSLANKGHQKSDRIPTVNLEEEIVDYRNNDEQQDELADVPYYAFPDIRLLHPPIMVSENDHWIDEQTALLNDTFINFNVHAKVVNVTQGPSVTRYEVQPEPGVKVSKITNLTDDLKLSLAAKDIRIEAPIPGKHTVGIEVPNQASRPVLLREILESPEFMESTSPLTVAMGLDISGKPIVTDLRKMPHGLIAGATGSGKSVCINTMLVSLLYKANPEELKLLLIDPKMVELAPYNYIPHLASPVITDVKTATAALKWAVEEMERRYELLAHAGARDITKYNQLAEDHKRYSHKLPYLVIIIDELADLMMMAPADVEEAISRIAQKARACGIHLLIATQRPSVDVITGLIKANVPTRIAFSVSSQIDSRTVIDMSGAEKLLGKGDMLFLENGTSKPVRLQGTFVADEEIDLVVAHVRKERTPEYLFEQEEILKKVQTSEEEDELFFEACEFVIEQGGASTSSLQRNFKIGYNRAARLMDMMEKQGYISEARGTKPREVFISENDLLQLQENE